MNIEINQILSAFSLALDIAENQPLEHAQRTAYIALQVAIELKLPVRDLEEINIAALLHDVGVTHSKAEAHEDRNQLVSHCMLGKEIVDELPFISSTVGEYIAWHHANWDGSGFFVRKGMEIPTGAQLVYLADQVDLRIRGLNSIYTQRNSILDFVTANKGILFQPEVVEAFLMVQSREKFWLDYSTYGIAEYTPDLSYSIRLNLESLEVLALTFARIIDNKSSFTYYHSQGVAEWAVKLGKFYGFDAKMIQMLKISGLLHDLGKLAVSNDILDKPGKVTEIEFQSIKAHPYYTKRILSKITGFEEIKEWAGNHHETLAGSGYPEGIAGNRLGIPDRIVAICDMYQALTEERPYRQKPMSQEKVFEILDYQAQNNKICPKVWAAFKKMLAGEQK